MQANSVKFGSWDGNIGIRDEVLMPFLCPQFFQRHSFYTAVHESDIDCFFMPVDAKPPHISIYQTPNPSYLMLAEHSAPPPILKPAGNSSGNSTADSSSSVQSRRIGFG